MIIPIQILLIGALLVLLGLYLRFFQHKPFRRFLLAGVMLTGLVFVVFPELTNKLASMVGVGRGADLLLYVGVILVGFLFLHVYSRLKRIEASLTEVVRNQALAEKGKQPKRETSSPD